ncbi:MAG: EF-P beta-lysylation protein EpmB [Pseudomonadales bacterium]
MIPASRHSGLTDNYIASTASPVGTGTPDEGETCWQRELAAANVSIAELLARLQIPLQHYSAAAITDRRLARFPLRVTESFIRRMRMGDIEDPLLRQILPVVDELASAPGYSDDPLQENAYNMAPGLIHKYRSRALLIVTQACAVHCRYCFRKEFPYQENRASQSNWEPALQHLRNDPSIREVILSGGDPLAVSDRHLGGLLKLIAGIAHVKRLRIHTRLPVVLPSRITGNLLQAIQQVQKKCVLVVHCNHSAELNAEVGAALAKLKTNGITLLNQAVLLRGVNDSVAVQVELAECLFDHGVLPYYLHQLDKVSGTSHFEVSDERARAIHAGMRDELAGYLLPRLVREVPGAMSKLPVF